MEQLLDGFVPGLPVELKQRILTRAEGVPLYAVETIRMLLDRGLLAREGGVYRTTGAVEELDVPETLQGLISARLDGLGADERRLLQDAAVLGKTFTRESLATLAGLDEPDLDPLLASLVRKEVLAVQADPRSPERGQYGFLQDLVRRVAYDTLARRERKSRHLAAAAQLEARFGTVEQEIVEVVASHYVAAYEAQPDDGDAEQIKERACELLARAGDRAGSLAAAGEARRYYEQAAGLADETLERARLLEQAGRMAGQNVEYDAAMRLFGSALELLQAAGDTHAAARVSGALASPEYQTGHIEAAIERLEGAFATVAADEPDADIAELAARLAQMRVFAGDLERADEPLELALRVAQEQRLPATLCRALITKAVALSAGRPEEGLALMRHALRHALENDVSELVGLAQLNLADLCCTLDRYGEALDHHHEALALGRRIGDRRRAMFTLSELSYAFTMLGRWDEALAVCDEIPDEVRSTGNLVSLTTGVLEIHLHQGRLGDAETLLGIWSEREATSEVQTRACLAGARAGILFTGGRHAHALEAGVEAADLALQLGYGQQGVKQGFVWAVDAALALGDDAQANQLLGRVESLPPGLRPPFLEAHAHRFRARMSGDEVGFKAAAGGFREYGFAFWLAVTELEHGEWLAANGRSADATPLLAEAREIFERLGAAPWLDRLERLEPRVAVAYGRDGHLRRRGDAVREGAAEERARSARGQSRGVAVPGVGQPERCERARRTAVGERAWGDRGQFQRGGRRLRADVLGDDREVRLDAAGGHLNVLVVAAGLELRLRRGEGEPPFARAVAVGQRRPALDGDAEHRGVRLRRHECHGHVLRVRRAVRRAHLERRLRDARAAAREGEASACLDMGARLAGRRARDLRGRDLERQRRAGRRHRVRQVPLIRRCEPGLGPVRRPLADVPRLRVEQVALVGAREAEHDDPRLAADLPAVGRRLLEHGMRWRLARAGCRAACDQRGDRGCGEQPTTSNRPHEEAFVPAAAARRGAVSIR